MPQQRLYQELQRNPQFADWWAKNKGSGKEVPPKPTDQARTRAEIMKIVNDPNNYLLSDEQKTALDNRQKFSLSDTQIRPEILEYTNSLAAEAGLEPNVQPTKQAREYRDWGLFKTGEKQSNIYGPVTPTVKNRGASGSYGHQTSGGGQKTSRQQRALEELRRRGY